ncbi:hypothetical protein CSV79_15890 [Sporosarcina sp. P13]|uniref:hypothetical protein n=1 Tax=Sporosarcina sp. P13 TaxID=2048263 RepID=UPI000C170298|nr:hypothetical protein [Sporosarcina sp. P13]PIC62665.1 hypothetical protein CSV79_15890 [Sporosarcina sp. P13]
MFEDFKLIDPLFEDQVHERHQFCLTIIGDEYTGIIEDGEVSWYHPQPQTVLSEQHVNEVEAGVIALAKLH